MLSKKVKCVVKNVLVGLVLLTSVDIGGVKYNVHAKTPTNDSGIKIKQEQSKGRILIYHSHTHEINKDGTIIDIGADLKRNLEKQGFIVDHIKDNFSIEYKKSYINSKKMLDSKDLNSYNLALDLHIDAGDKARLAKDKQGNDVAIVMPVNTKKNCNLEHQTKIATFIREEMKKYGTHMVRNDYVKWNYGNRHYNLNMNKNMMLLEMGTIQNDMKSIEGLNKYLAKVLAEYIVNNK